LRKMPSLKDRTILLGLTGGIACYKAADLLRALVKEGSRVRVVMSRGAREFIAPLTLQTLSGNPVATETFDLTQESEIGHIRLADSAEVVLVAPATANVIAKLAHGIADDLLTTLILATRAPVIIAPAMNVHMYENPLVRRNLKRLIEVGMRVVPPAEGFLACGYEGPGRLADETALIESVRSALSPQDLVGERILVTAGPTREAVDPVRFVSNRSSGKMGFAVAAAARRRGAEVVLVSGPVSLATPPGVERADVTTAAGMRSEVLRRQAWPTMIVMAAAVADFRPAAPAPRKVKKREKKLSLRLERTTDILAELGRKRRPGQVLVGFAAETENGIENARKKLEEKGLDLIVLNNVSESDAGFDVDTNRVWLIQPHGQIEEWPLLGKDEVADRLVERLARLRGEGASGAGKRGTARVAGRSPRQTTSGTSPLFRAPAKRSR
jgi:phosphopantothenoylcysteine decarboxylase / phosphopantothenate---cysteine ligase